MQNKPRLTSLSLAVVATTLLLGSSSALAANYKDEYKDQAPVVIPTCVELHDGFYIGAQVGYDSYRVRATTTAAPIFAAGGTISLNPVINNTGWVGGLFAGYGMYFNNLYYLAAEIFGNGSGASQNFNIATAGGTTGGANYYGKTSVSGSYGISLLPGIKLNNATLLYIRLGYERANLKNQVTVTPPGGPSTYSSNSSWQGGFQYGIGMESVVYQNFSLRAEYTHVGYSSFSNTYTSVKPSDNQFMFGLVYHFA